MKKDIIKKQNVQGKILIVGIDVSKNFHVATFRLTDGTEKKKMKFLNNIDGFNTFYSTIEQIRMIYKLERTVVGLESTGVYAQPLKYFLQSKGIKPVGINPAHTKKSKELMDNSPQKDDFKDSRTIADLVAQGKYYYDQLPVGVHANLRALSHAREQVIKNQTMIKNSIKDILCIIFPEFENIFLRHNFTKTALYLLKHFPTPENIIALGKERLLKLIKEKSRCKLGEKQACELYTCAQNSISVKEAREGYLFQLKILLANLNNISHQIYEIEYLLIKELEQIPCSKNILSIKGIGEVTAAVILGETGELTNYRSAKELIKLAGLNLYETSSGKHKGYHHITKRGRPLLRAILYLASIRLVKKGYAFYDYYQKKISQGKIKNKVLIAIAKKILILIRSLVLSKSNYIENYNQKNIQSVGDNRVFVRDINPMISILR